MALLRKTTTQFTVPTLGDVSPEYAFLEKRGHELHAALSALLAERKQLEAELKATPAPTVRPAVAALLGDKSVDARAAVVDRLKIVRGAIADHETAVELQRRRLGELRGPASVAVCKAIRPEYLRRADKIAKALEAALEASAEMDALVFDLDSRDVAWSYVGDNLRAVWLGTSNEGRAATYVAAVKAEAAR